MSYRFVIVIALLLAIVGAAAHADQNAEKLDSLLQELAAAKDPITAQAIEQEVWRAWMDSGNEDVNRELEAGIRAMDRGRLDEAIRRFSTVIEKAPNFAEGWNKRATAYYLNNELVESMQDIRQTLHLEPRHFGAISGMGLIYLRLGDDLAALQAFEEVLKIYPLSPGANQHVKQLTKKLEGQII